MASRRAREAATALRSANGSLPGERGGGPRRSTCGARVGVDTCGDSWDGVTACEE